MEVTMDATIQGRLDVSAVVPGAVCHRGVTYAERLGFRPLLMDVYVPLHHTGPVPCVMWVHGGAWWEGDRRFLPDVWEPGGLFRELVVAGLAVATVDYRLSGEACWPAQLDDVRDALGFLREHAAELGLGPIGVAGESAGGHLAAMLALTDDVDAAALLYAVTDLLDWDEVHATTPDEALDTPEGRLLGTSPDADPEGWANASPLSHVHAAVPPTLIITGDADAVVPARQSMRLHEALVAAGAPDVELELVAGADHCFGGVDPTGPLRRVVEFLAARLA
jgi:acetyl esterase/lipase